MARNLIHSLTWATASLLALFPDRGEGMAGLGKHEGCSVSIGAGVADQPILPVDNWPEANVANWNEGDTVNLHSRHPSRPEGWSCNLFSDYHGADKAPGSDCRCKPDGTLLVLCRG